MLRGVLLASRTLLGLSWLAPSVVSLVTTDPLAISNKTYDYIIVGGGTAGLAVSCIRSLVCFTSDHGRLITGSLTSGS